MQKTKKASVSITTCVGRELFDLLEAFCAETGQSKTIAVERAIKSYCAEAGSPPAARPDFGPDKDGGS